MQRYTRRCRTVKLISYSLLPFFGLRSNCIPIRVQKTVQKFGNSNQGKVLKFENSNLGKLKI